MVQTETGKTENPTTPNLALEGKSIGLDGIPPIGGVVGWQGSERVLCGCGQRKLGHNWHGRGC